jgi:hypothetical protein
MLLLLPLCRGQVQQYAAAFQESDTMKMKGAKEYCHAVLLNSFRLPSNILVKFNRPLT